MSGFEFKPIPHTDARLVQKYTLQDVELGGFPDPKGIANPRNPILLLKQMRKLKNHPENYLGAYYNDTLKGYMKIADWRVRDEKKFATEAELEEIELLESLATDLTPQRKLGIFGLVVSNKVEPSTQTEIAKTFLDVATHRGEQVGAVAVNIIFHEHDPVREVAEEKGYVFTGRTGEADGAPGLIQDLHAKPILDIRALIDRS